MDLVSVIVPVYNVKQYLNECIQSIVNQTYTDLEIILIDDGSTDGSGELCNEYQKIDERITVIHQQNTGLSGARNTGISASTGEYLCFVDSDDYIRDNYVDKLYKLVKEYDADISECAHIEVFDKQDMSAKLEDESLSKDAVEFFDEGKKLLFSVFDVMVWKRLYKREILSDLRFVEGKYHEDEYFSYIAAYKARSAVKTSAGLYYYRRRLGSITKTELTDKRIVDCKNAFRYNIDFFEKEENADTIVELIKNRYAYYLAINYNAIKRSMGKSYAKETKSELKSVYKSIKNKSKFSYRSRILIRLYILFPPIARLVNKVYIKVKS